MSSNSSSPDVPPFFGYVETTVNALRLIHAARQGVIPRITRRLNDSERRTMVQSGAVFVFSVEESGIKRWTDGLLWSPSRIVGNFLVYREINERNSGRGSHKKPYPVEESSCRGAIGNLQEQKSLRGSHTGLANDQGTLKSNGLIKKTITVTIDGSDLHLISYYTSDDVRSGLLKRPSVSTRPDIMALDMPPHIFRLTNFRNPPKIEIGPDNKPRLVCDAEDHGTVEVKVEEARHHLTSLAWPTNSFSQASQAEEFTSSSSSNCSSPSISHSSFYSDGGGERWRGQYESSRISPLRTSNGSRHETTWSPQTNDSHTSTRRGSDFAPQSQSASDSWPSFQSHRGHWQTDQYSTSAPSDEFLDRSRSRSSNSYQSSMPVENEVCTPVYPGQVTAVAHDIRYDARHHRSPWMAASGAEKLSRNPFSTLSGHGGQQFSAAQVYDSHVPPLLSSGSWSSSSASSLGSPSSGYSRPQLPSYDTLYIQATSEEEYGAVAEYTSGNLKR